MSVFFTSPIPSDVLRQGGNLAGLTNLRTARNNLSIVAEQGGWIVREEFRNGSAGLALLSTALAGGSANTTITPVAGENRDGIVQCRTGATGAIDQRGGFSSNMGHFLPGDGNAYYCGFGVRAVAPYFDGALQGRIELGLANVISTLGGGFIGFVSTNGGNWICHSASGGPATTFDTGLPVASTAWRDLALVYYPNGTRIDWFSAGVRIHTFWATTGTNDATNTFSANINTATAAGIKAHLIRTVATATQVSFDLDYVDFGVKFSTARYNATDLPMNTFKQIPIT